MIFDEEIEETNKEIIQMNFTVFVKLICSILNIISKMDLRLDLTDDTKGPILTM